MSGTKGSRKNKFAFCCRPPGPLARRERRCVPGAVREERATKPAGLRAAARRGAILRVPDYAAKRKHGSKLITDSSARMRSYFCASPKVEHGTGRIVNFLRLASNLLTGFAFLLVSSSPAMAQTAPGKPLLWGADAEGGAPYEFQDPRDPSRIIGFEVDIIDAIG